MAASADPLPPAAGWSWRILRRDEVALVWPVVLIVDGQDMRGWISEARAWIAAHGPQGGIAAVQCGFGTICGLFLFDIRADAERAVLHAERLLCVEQFGVDRTFAALLRAVRELADLHADGLACVHAPRAGPPGSAADVAVRLGFVVGPDCWYLHPPIDRRSLAGLSTLVRPLNG